MRAPRCVSRPLMRITGNGRKMPQTGGGPRRRARRRLRRLRHGCGGDAGAVGTGAGRGRRGRRGYGSGRRRGRRGYGSRGGPRAWGVSWGRRGGRLRWAPTASAQACCRATTSHARAQGSPHVRRGGHIRGAARALDVLALRSRRRAAQPRPLYDRRGILLPARARGDRGALLSHARDDRVTLHLGRRRGRGPGRAGTEQGRTAESQHC